MTARTLVGAGLCAVFVPLVSALPPSLPDNRGVVVVEAEAAQATTQEPAVRSTRLERTDASAGLAAAVTGIQRANAGPLWIAWTVPAVASRDRGDSRWNDGGVGRCVLDDDGEIHAPHGVNGGTRRLVMLARSQGAQITRVAFTDERCSVDAGSRPVFVLSGVAADQSVAVLARLVRDEGSRAGAAKGHNRRSALPALALHDTPAADAALAEFVTPGQPREVRRDAAFWLGAARGDAGAAVVERLSREDADEDFREHLTFVLTLVGDRGIDTLIGLARRDASAKVRGQAMFWLGQSGDARAVGFFEEVLRR